MGKHLLSQEEIDALLNSDKSHKEMEELTLEEKDALGKWEYCHGVSGYGHVAAYRTQGEDYHTSVSIIEKRLPRIILCPILP